MFYESMNGPDLDPDWSLTLYHIRKLASKLKLSSGTTHPSGLACGMLIYRCLADKTVQDSQKRAVYYMMVSHQIGFAFVNLLPLGISAPLRAARLACRRFQQISFWMV